MGDGLWRLAVDQAAIGMGVLALDGRLLDVNAALCRMLGRDADALRTSTWLELTHADDAALVRSHLAALLEDDPSVVRFHQRLARAAGGHVWAEVALAAVHAADGSPSCLSLQVLSVNDGGQAQEGEAEHGAGVASGDAGERLTRQQFERLFHNDPTMMAVSDAADGRITNVNKAFLDGVGYARDEVLGRTLPELGLFASPQELDEHVADVADGGRAGIREMQLRRKDGELRHCLLLGETITGDGQESYLIVLLDVTDRK